MTGDEQRRGQFAGKIAVVTGGSRGIGRTIALDLAARGTDVAFNYLKNHRAARETQSEIEALGVRCLRVRSHLADPDAIASLFAQIADEFGHIDYLVNNAASGVMRPATELDVRHWDWTLDINARAPWLCAVEAARLMRRGGRIVNISSPGATKVLTSYFAVGVSKAALEALTRYLATELSPRGIGVNAVSAGYVLTDAIDAFPDELGVREVASRPTPAGRTVTAEDVAKAVSFLCSDEAEMIRGHVLMVDGGETLLHR